MKLEYRYISYLLAALIGVTMSFLFHAADNSN